MTPITLRGLHKRFGQVVAVDHVDLHVESGELFFLLGPSGCGKTTLLRMIAGFTEPTGGTIHFGDDEVTARPANKRQCGMVFQNYALWPHMSVRQNVGFGLDVRKVAGDEKHQRIDHALRTVQMLAYANRKPNELSGGEQQRIALARALVIEPTVLLLDEPLSNLDAKLRLDMRSQIRQICKDIGITTVYVTHDQKEALSMADRVAVMNQGRVVQVATPRQLYEKPNSRFVADFLGETNFVTAQIVERTDRYVVLDTAAGRLHSAAFPEDLPKAGNVTCSIRPEAIKFVDDKSQQINRLEGRRTETTYLGEMAQHHIAVTDALTLKVFELNPRLSNEDDGKVQLTFEARDVVILQD